MEKGLYNLIIDEEFSTVFPPRIPKDEEKLISQLRTEGCRDEIITWNGIIIDGHTRYRICHEYNIPFSYREMSFPSKERAKMWMIKNQVARRNLTVFQRCMLIIPLEEEFKKEAEERRREKIREYRKSGETVANCPPSEKTRDLLADIADTSSGTLRRVKYILENGDDEIKKQLCFRDKSIYKAFSELKAKEANSVSVAEDVSNDDDYDDSEDQRLHEMIRAMPKENTTDPRADNTVRDEEADIPVEKIGGYEPAVYQAAPITMSSSLSQ